MSEGREQTIRDIIGAQNRRLKSGNLRERAVDSLFGYCELGRRLPGLTDRQVGQLVFDFVLDDLVLVSPAMSLSMEASERLFRSSAGARTTARFNVPGQLPICPRCGEEMMRYVGLGQSDYRQCVSLKCGYKIEERID
jgi:hypothetical protein